MCNIDLYTIRVNSTVAIPGMNYVSVLYLSFKYLYINVLDSYITVKYFGPGSFIFLFKSPNVTPKMSLVYLLVLENKFCSNGNIKLSLNFI